MFPVRWQDGVLRVAYSANPENVLELNLSNQNLTGKELRGLYNSLRHSLQHLNLAFNAIPSLTLVSDFRHLSYLNVMHNKLRSLHGIESLKLLTTLQCSHNEISDISPLSQLTELETLSLDRNNITELEQLRHLVPLQNLHSILLTRNPCTTRIKQVETCVLHALPGLQTINGRAVTETMRDQAKRMHVASLIPEAYLEETEKIIHSRERTRKHQRRNHQRENQHVSSGKASSELSYHPFPNTNQVSQTEYLSSEEQVPVNQRVIVQKNEECFGSGSSPLREHSNRFHASLVKPETKPLNHIQKVIRSGNSFTSHSLITEGVIGVFDPSNTAIAMQNSARTSRASSPTSVRDTRVEDAADTRNNRLVQQKRDKSEIIKYPKSGARAITFFTDGSVQVKWPSATLAISINCTQDGWTSYAATSNGNVILSFDEKFAGCINYDNGKAYLTVTQQGFGMVQERNGKLLETFTIGVDHNRRFNLKVSQHLGIEFHLGSAPGGNPSILLYFACGGLRQLLQHGENPCSPEAQEEAGCRWKNLDRRRKPPKSLRALPLLVPSGRAVRMNRAKKALKHRHEPSSTGTPPKKNELGHEVDCRLPVVPLARELLNSQADARHPLNGSTSRATSAKSARSDSSHRSTPSTRSTNSSRRNSKRRFIAARNRRYRAKPKWYEVSFENREGNEPTIESVNDLLKSINFGRASK